MCSVLDQALSLSSDLLVLSFEEFLPGTSRASSSERASEKWGCFTHLLLTVSQFCPARFTREGGWQRIEMRKPHNSTLLETFLVPPSRDACYLSEV